MKTNFPNGLESSRTGSSDAVRYPVVYSNTIELSENATASTATDTDIGLPEDVTIVGIDVNVGAAYGTNATIRFGTLAGTVFTELQSVTGAVGVKRGNVDLITSSDIIIRNASGTSANGTGTATVVVYFTFNN